MTQTKYEIADTTLRKWVLGRIQDLKSFYAEDLLAENLQVDKHRMYEHPNWTEEYARMLRVLKSLKEEHRIEERPTGYGFSLYRVANIEDIEIDR